MTMSNNEMVGLFPSIIACMSIYDLDIKKMCFLYLLTYAMAKPKIALEAIPILIEDLTDNSPLIRALALRTVSSIPVKEYFHTSLDYSLELIHDEDPYVRKTAAFAVAKLWNIDSKIVEKSGLITELNNLLSNSNPTVVAAALAALMDITEKTNELELSIDRTNAFNLAHILPDCNEWSQNYILRALMNFVPMQSSDAALLIERVLPRLQYNNASIVLCTIRLIVYLSNFVPDLFNVVPNIDKKIGPALVILLAKPAEIQYLALRNCILLLQSRPELLNLDVKVFICKYNDPIYVKATKLEIIFLLANKENISTVLREFQECATEIDVHVVRKSVRAIGKLAIKIESAAEACIAALMDLVSTRISYIVQEATVVIRNIFRRYPNRYESVISVLCDNLGSLDEPEAKAAMIWIIGQYAHRIDNAQELLENFLSTFLDEPIEVQLSLLTAIVKLFIFRPSKGQDMVPRVLKMATEEVDNPDLRDRGYMYWRLLSADTQAAKSIVAAPLPEITTDSDRMDDDLLEELELVIGTLATLYLKPIKQVFRNAKARKLPQSPALAPRQRSVSISSSVKSSNGKFQPPIHSNGYNSSSTSLHQYPYNNSGLLHSLRTMNISDSQQEKSSPTALSFNSSSPGPLSPTANPNNDFTLAQDSDKSKFSNEDLIQIDERMPQTSVVSQNGMNSANVQKDILW